MDQVEEIKRKIDVVDLISSYLSVKKAGRNYRACCPFHNEKTPSFMVSPEKQIWYCFGCNQGGDIFTFVEKIEGLDFSGALSLLADRSGVILDKRGDFQKGKKDKLFEMLNLSSKFFSYLLNEHKIGQEAKEYLVEKRHLDSETIDKFSLGYAPESNDTLKKFLIKKGFSEQEIFSAGLLAEKNRGMHIDKFRDRIIFPIKNVSGKTLGFGGRIFKEKKDSNFTPPKYLNSPQTDVYDKSSAVYGLYEAKEAIRENDLAIIVEGYLDVISSHRIGVKNVVASSGTALTERQVEIISRYTENIAFCFDTDQAGQMATKRAMELLEYSNINLKAIVIPEGKDPDELINKNPEKWLEISKKPIPIMEFFYNSVFQKNNLAKSVDDKKSITKELIPFIARISNDIEKAYWIKKIAHDLSIQEKYIIDAIAKMKPQFATKKESSENIDSELVVKLEKETLLLLSLIIYPEKINHCLAKLSEEDLLIVLSKNIYKQIIIWHNKENKGELSLDFIKEGLNEKEKNISDVLFFLTSSFFEDLEKKDVLQDIDSLLGDVLRNKKNQRKNEIEKELSFLNKEKDKERIRELLRELQSLI